MHHKAFWEDLSSKEAEKILSSQPEGTFLLHSIDSSSMPFYAHLHELEEKEVDLSILSSKKSPGKISHRYVVEEEGEFFFYNDEPDFHAPYLQKFKDIDHLIASDEDLKYPLPHP